jgi:outer membrane autotransporter protein
MTEGGNTPALYDAVLKSNYNDDVFSAGIKASYVWILGNEVRVTPSIGTDFSHVKLQSFDERVHSDTNPVAGQSPSLRSTGSSYTNIAVPVMVSINKTYGSDFLMFKGARSLWTPEVRAGWTPQFGSRHAGAKLSAINNPGIGEYKTQSNSTASSYGTVGAGLKIKLADKFIFAVDYDYTFARDYANHSVTGMYGVSF